MGFDSGSVSFRLFSLSRAFDDSVVEQFARHTVPPIETLVSEPLCGWVGARHLLDREITAEHCVLGGYLHVTYLCAERKIPEALLRAHCRLEEDLEQRARGVAFLPRKVRGEIRDRVRAELLPAMPPTLTGIPVVLDFRNDLLLAGAMSNKQIDALTRHFRETTGVVPNLLTAEVTALQRRQLNSLDLDATSFAPQEVPEESEEATLGMDFLTWLWYFWESTGGVFRRSNGRQMGVMLEGPLTFFHEGAGAHEAVIRKGMPLNSREAGVALYCGKKLKRAKLLIAEGDTLLTALIDADFGFRSLKLPKSEQPDPIGRFQERMLHIETYRETFFDLYDRFLELRADSAQWATTVDAMQKWVAQRAAL